MTTQNSNSSQNLFCQEGVQTDSLIKEYNIIDKYLNLHSFRSKFQQTPQAQIQQEQLIRDEVTPFIQPRLSVSATKTKQSKSPFHNFQKHLIMIIKKFVSLSRKKLLQEEGGALAYSIWTIFQESNSINKKLLNLVFGVVEINTSFLQLQYLSKQNEAFHQIYKQNSYEQICYAQQMLREKVVVQSKSLSKQFLRSNCNIGKFEQFYLYFRSFIDQIQAGPLSRRMNKETKSRIMSRGSSKI